MRLEQSFDVVAPIERVWQTLTDIERVAPCLPGATVTGRNEDGSYSGTFEIKIGPTSASYAGKLEMVNLDAATHRATMSANGTDRRGQGGAKATIVSTLTPLDGGSRVDVVTDYSITGRLARFGRGGMIEDISERLLRQFAACLQASLTSAESGETVIADAGAPAGGQPVEGVSLLASVAGDRARRNPAAVLALGAAIALIALARRRARRAHRLSR